MDTITVGYFRKILERALEAVEDYDDNDIVKTVSNTYFVKSSTFLGTSDGYIDLHDIRVEERYDDDDEYNDDED